MKSNNFNKSGLFIQVSLLIVLLGIFIYFLSDGNSPINVLFLNMSVGIVVLLSLINLGIMRYQQNRKRGSYTYLGLTIIPIFYLIFTIFSF